MSDLISRSALLAKMKQTSRYFAVKFDIEEAPAVDAVPVVRCEECIKKKAGDVWNMCYVWETGVPNAGFCFKGERRSND